MLNVLITIDTEVYPLLPDSRRDNLARDIDRDIYGRTPEGEFGLTYQVETLARHGLKAVFFVEALFATSVGLEPLERMVRTIRSGGHEIQLHVHPEWLGWTPDSPIEARSRHLMSQFSMEEQAELIAWGLRNLAAAGSPEVQAFRAGDFAANGACLEAARGNGIRFDSSCNATSPLSFPAWKGRAATQPVDAWGMVEVPVSYWDAAPLGLRHAQLTTASWGELKCALSQALHRRWPTFVIVSHSFELLKARRRRPSRPAPDRVVKSRFESLCRFLAERRDAFRTVGFEELQQTLSTDNDGRAMLALPPWRTAQRLFEQAYRRLT